MGILGQNSIKQAEFDQVRHPVYQSGSHKR